MASGDIATWTRVRRAEKGCRMCLLRFSPFRGERGEGFADDVGMPLGCTVWLGYDSKTSETISFDALMAWKFEKLPDPSEPSHSRLCLASCMAAIAV